MKIIRVNKHLSFNSTNRLQPHFQKLDIYLPSPYYSLYEFLHMVIVILKKWSQYKIHNLLEYVDNTSIVEYYLYFDVM